MGFLFGGDTADKLNKDSFKDPNAAANKMLLDKQRAALGAQQSTQMNTAQGDQARGVQSGLVNQLQQQASGQGPSLAAAQANQSADRGMAQQMAMAAGRGGNPALMQRQALMNNAAISQNAAANAVQGRMQEQMNAQGALANLSGQMRAQDIGQAGTQAQLDASHQQQVNDLTQRYLAMGLSVDQAQFQAQQDMEKTRAQMLQNDANRFGQGLGSIFNAAGAIGSVALGK